MEITPLGFIIIPLGFVLFWRDTFLGNSKALFWALVFSAPFFSANVLLLSIFTARIKIHFFLGGLLLLSYALRHVMSTKRLGFSLSKEALLLLWFWCAILVSLFMPVIHKGEELVFPIETKFLEFVHFQTSFFEPLKLRRANFTQALYPIFMGMLFLGLIREMKSISLIKKVLKISVGLSLLVAFSGFFYQAVLATGKFHIFESWYYFLSGRSQARELGSFEFLPRMYSIVGEPGFTDVYLLFALGIVATLVLSRQTNLLWGNKNRIFFVFLFITLLLTGGTTGFLGIAILFVSLLFIPLLFRLRLPGSYFSYLSKGLILIVIITILAFAAFTLLGIPIIDYIYYLHIEKLAFERGSGVHRYNMGIVGFQIFLRYPWLGVGIGSHRTTAVLSTLLSNVGLLGTLPFLLLNLTIFRRGVYVCRNSKDPDEAILSLCLLISLATVFGTMLFAKALSSLLYLFYWLLLAMLAAVNRHAKVTILNNKAVGKTWQSKHTPNVLRGVGYRTG